MVDSPVGALAQLPGTLVLWDVDHTLIENGGVSKATYARAFELLTGHAPDVRPMTDGRTDFQIMRELLAANSVDADQYTEGSQLQDVLLAAMDEKAPELPERGHVLPGVVEALTALSTVPTAVQSVLTGNISPNAFAKLHAFDLDKWVDLDVGGFGSDDIVRSKLVDSARRKVEAKYGLAFDRSSTVLVGDTLLDIKAAHDGDAKVIAVATGVYSVEQLTDAGADHVLESLADFGQFADALLAVRLGS
ncbi:MAG TPA: HAD hydrolase-like protein [Pseudonocardiaceae bacterium]|nr:HAD hydrolase-like protein [Pseudonocardiaceae bacterium]